MSWITSQGPSSKNCPGPPYPLIRLWVGLFSQKKHQAPTYWNMKRYKSVQLLSTLNFNPPLDKRKAPLTNAKPPYWRLSGDGSAWNHPFHDSDVVVVNVTSQSRNPYAIPIGDVVLTKKVWEVGNAPINLATLKHLQTHFKTKHEKGVGRPLPIEATATQSGNCSWFAAKSSRFFALLAV